MVFKSKYADVKPDEKYKDLVSNFFWAQLDKFGQNLLFVDYETRREWTGAQLKRASANVARQLIKFGLRANDDCVLFYKHCDHIQIAALAILFAGCSLCTGHPPDPEPEHAYMLEAIKPTFVFVGRELLEEVLGLRDRLKLQWGFAFKIVVMDDAAMGEKEFRELLAAKEGASHRPRPSDSDGEFEERSLLGLHHDLLQDSHSDAPLPVQVDPQRPAFTLLTSGSTGRPKPVCRTQRNSLYVCHSFMGAEDLLDLDESSVVSAHAAFDHGTGIFIMKQCLTRGYKSIIIDGGFDPFATVLEAVKTFRITDLIIGSALVDNMLKDVFESSGAELDARLQDQFGSLRNVIAVGAPLVSQSLVGEFMGRLPNCSVRQAFGMTECGFLFFVPREMALRARGLAPGIVGRPMPNVELKLVRRQKGADSDTEGEEVTAFDEEGELYVRSPTVSPGYVGDQFRGQGRDNFRPDGFYKSNDICMLGSDGLLRVIGRFSDVLCLPVNWKVLPSEIEHTIMQHPLVKEAAVVGIPHPELPRNHLVRAYVVPRSGVAVREDDAAPGEGTDRALSKQLVFDFVAERLAEPKHLAGGIKFLAELPRISIGKVDKKALRRADGY